MMFLDVIENGGVEEGRGGGSGREGGGEGWSEGVDTAAECVA